MISGAIDFILPPNCVVSGEPVERQGMIAPHVWSRLDFIADPVCSCCGLPFEFHQDEGVLCGECLAEKPDFTRARSALIYNESSRALVLRFKHADQIHAVKAFLPWMIRAGAEILEDADFLIPVPLHKWRLLKRRYNQSAIIAHALAKEGAGTYLPDALERVRSTPPQGHKKARDREKNVRNAFVVPDNRKAEVKEKKVVLIDDVYTTGSTVNECAAALLKEGCSRVDVLTLARVVRSG